MKEKSEITREYFIRLLLAGAEGESSTPERARMYLKDQGLDADEIIKVGTAEMEVLRSKMKSVTSLKKVSISRSRRWTHPSVVRLIKESGNPDPLDEIRNRARELVFMGFAHGWEGPPFSPIDLARLVGIKVTPQDSVPDACIIPSKDGFEIEYNPFQQPTRINFSIAHDITHTLFSDCADAIRNREQEPIENRELEQLCNAGGAEILLPYAIFSNDANSAAASMEGLIDLAKRYRASLESVFIRYTEVVDRPCAIFIGVFKSRDNIVIDYWKASRHLPFSLPDAVEIPPDSKVYECVSPGWTSREAAEWSVFAGRKFTAYAIGISPYKRDKKPRVGVLLLPNEYAHERPDTRKIVLEYGDATKPRGKGKMIIAQVVNSYGALGFGFGLSLAKNYPAIKDRLAKWKADKASFVLGNSQLVEVNSNLYVFQMLAQKGVRPKDGEVLLKYPELRRCLISLREIALDLKASVHMPAIGAGQAGGDWHIIIGMIHDELVNYDIKVNIYLLPGKSFNPKQRSHLTIFKEDSTWQTGK
jgi:hypothetical protein